MQAARERIETKQNLRTQIVRLHLPKKSQWCIRRFSSSGLLRRLYRTTIGFEAVADAIAAATDEAVVDDAEAAADADPDSAVVVAVVDDNDDDDDDKEDDEDDETHDADTDDVVVACVVPTTL